MTGEDDAPVAAAADAARRAYVLAAGEQPAPWRELPHAERERWLLAAYAVLGTWIVLRRRLEEKRLDPPT